LTSTDVDRVDTRRLHLDQHPMQRTGEIRDVLLIAWKLRARLSQRRHADSRIIGGPVQVPGCVYGVFEFRVAFVANECGADNGRQNYQ
jgi:hypothetical protein